MVQNPKYWRAKECARLQNKTQLTKKVLFYLVHISQWSLVTFFCSPIFWIFVPCDLQLQRAYYLKNVTDDVLFV